MRSTFSPSFSLGVTAPVRTVHVTHKHSRLPRPVKALTARMACAALVHQFGSGPEVCSGWQAFDLTGSVSFGRMLRRLRHRDFSTLMTQSGPDAPAQSVGRVARLSGNVRQPNHVLANEIAGHKAERRPRAGEEWLAATKYDGVEVKSILINKTKVG